VHAACRRARVSAGGCRVVCGARLAVRVLALVHAAVGCVLGAHVRAHDVAELVPARAPCVRALNSSRSTQRTQHTFTTNGKSGTAHSTHTRLMASLWQVGYARSCQSGVCTQAGASTTMGAHASVPSRCARRPCCAGSSCFRPQIRRRTLLCREPRRCAPRPCGASSFCRAARAGVRTLLARSRAAGWTAGTRRRPRGRGSWG